MKMIKTLGILAIVTLLSNSAFAAKDLTDTRKVGVMDSYKNCIKTMGGRTACGGNECAVEFNGNSISVHSHPCIRAGKVKASDYKGARAAAVTSLLKKHAYMMR